MKRFLLSIIICALGIMSHFAQSTTNVFEEYMAFVRTCNFTNAIKVLKQNQSVMTNSKDGVFLYNGLIGYALSKDGKYDDAVTYFGKCKEYLNVDFPDDESKILQATIWDEAGMSYAQLNDLQLAESCLTRSLNVLKQVDNRENLSILRMVLTHLGSLYNQLMLYNKAVGYLRDAKYLYESNMDFSVGYANVLCHWATLSFLENDFLSCKMEIDEATNVLYRNIQEDDTGFISQNANVSLLQTLNTALQVYYKLGLKEEVGKHYLTAKNLIRRKNGGDKASALLDFNIGCLYADEGNYALAKQYLRNSQKAKIAEYTFPINMALVVAEYCTQDKSSTNTSLLIAEQLMNDVASKFSFMSAEERSAYWNNYEGTIRAVYYILAHSDNPRTDVIYNTALFSKGLLLRTATKITEAIQASGDEELIKAQEKLNSYYELTADKNTGTQDLQVINDSITVIEKMLTHRINGYVSSKQFKDEYNWKSIQKVLDKDEAAIEFIDMPDTVNIDSLNNTSQTRYYAAIIKKGIQRPILIPICAEEALLNLLSMNNNLTVQRQITQLYTRRQKSKYWHGEEMYNCVWKPIERSLAGIKKVYFAPTGALHKVSFNSLACKDVFLKDTVHLRQVTSTSEIVSIKQEQNAMSCRSAYVYGGIVYDTDEAVMKTEARSYQHNDNDYAWRGQNHERGGWGFLQGTVGESQSVTEKLRSHGTQVTYLTGTQANEESFKGIKKDTHDVIHIATHGFFIASEEDKHKNPFIAGISNKQLHNDPMTRSGLIFSGGNWAWQGNNAVTGVDDGILTSKEISNIDLAGTQLAVLSACETGQGEVNSAEGVFGLQRAFKLAGTKSIIMSLWKVDDNATNLLMQNFYDNWMSGMDIENAFNHAIDVVRTNPQYVSPYYWGAFVLID